MGAPEIAPAVDNSIRNGLRGPALLAFCGFDAAPTGIKTEAGRMTLGLLYAGLPVLLKLGAIALMWGFPIGTAEQLRLRQAIEARNI